MAKKWELKMNEQRELRKQGIAVLYQRVVLLSECYADKSFLAWCEAHNRSELDYLDAEVSDVAATFLTLKAVLDANPQVEAWQKTDIRRLMADAMSSEKRGPSDRIGWKDRCLAAEKEIDRLRAELDILNRAMEIAGLKKLAA